MTAMAEDAQVLVKAQTPTLFYLHPAESTGLRMGRSARSLSYSQSEFSPDLENQQLEEVARDLHVICDTRKRSFSCWRTKHGR